MNSSVVPFAFSLRAHPGAERGAVEGVVADPPAERLESHRPADVDRRWRRGASGGPRPPAAGSRSPMWLGRDAAEAAKRVPAWSRRRAPARQRHSAQVANPSLSQISLLSAMLTLSPNHWWASSWATVVRPGRLGIARPGLGLERRRPVAQVIDDRAGVLERVRAEARGEEPDDLRHPAAAAGARRGPRGDRRRPPTRSRPAVRG